ncbi:MAG: SPOR domain-containing protein [Calditrichota bacterium]
MDTLRAILDRIPEESPIGQFLHGVFETDGETAKFVYDRVIALYPNTSAEAFALERLWQYHYALGDRANARKFYDFLKRRHPNYEDLTPAPDFELRDGLAELKVDTKPPEVIIPSTPSPSEPGQWTVQIGAFSSMNRARECGKKLNRFGEVFYVQRLTPNGELIAVQVGRLNAREAADKLLEQLQTATKLEGRVIAVKKP